MIGRIFANSYMPFCMHGINRFPICLSILMHPEITASWFEQEKLGILMGIFAFCGQLQEPLTATTASFV